MHTHKRHPLEGAIMKQIKIVCDISEFFGTDNLITQERHDLYKEAMIDA